MVRSAFTLIELIFAIVVMSIVMLSFPSIMQVDTDARERAFAQEAALAASAKMAQILTYQWDENSTDWNDLAENIQTSARLLDGTNFSTTVFDRVAGTQLRQNGGHRQFFAAARNPTQIGVNDSTLIIGIDEQNLSFGEHSGFDDPTNYAITTGYGYKRNYQMAVDILRIDDAASRGGVADVSYNLNALTGDDGFVFGQNEPTGIPAAGNTNLRAVVVSIQDENGRLLTRLFSYAANIGEYQAYSRIRP